ncbi:LOW QUALITY PROTEIN: sodium/hydrogen exchanger 1-like [Dermatophagoides pteronyssinus]|uniref:LOW QUALITY PROTEIN: sodium/hydrogen exchanger 1-like n=1 Tax=Dermatophagoides pteronyssinus TaxID=6956 RepID=UPI003F66A586
MMEQFLRIILESAFSLKHPQFYRNLLPILLYAIIGTLINIILIGMSLYAVMNINNDSTLSSISVLEMMIFSTSISAIDPVCVLALFKDFKVKKSLYYLVFGESLLNDAVVIVVHGILIETFRSTTSRSFSTITLFLNGFIKFVVVSFGSLFIGLFHGIFSTILTIIASKNRNGHYQEIEPILMIILSYGSYMIAELIGWSGVLSIIACGLFQTEFALANVSIRSRITVKSSIETLSSICDKMIFIFLGMIFIRNEHNWNFIFILYTIIFCILYRFIAIIILTFFVNHYWISRWSKLMVTRWIKFAEQILLVHVGLRGAIAFALISLSYQKQPMNYHNQSESEPIFFWQHNRHLLAFQLIDKLIFMRKNQLCRNNENILSRISIIWNNYYQKINNDSDCNDFQSNTSSMNMSTYQLFQTTTLFIIIFTVFIMGSTTQPLLAYLKIVIDNKHNRQAKLSKKPSCCCRFQCLPRQSNEKLFDRLNPRLSMWGQI